MQPISIFITAYLRQEFTRKCIQYLKERTKTPYTLFLLDNGGNSEFRKDVDYYVGFGQNMGIHAAWNTALALTTTDYFITTDNDLLVPDLQNVDEYESDGKKHWITTDTENPLKAIDWLTRMVKFMDERPDYGAISLHPHVFIGAAGIDPKDPEDVKERNMCGAVFRIMRTAAVRQAGGWENKIDPQRNHEERTICSRLQGAGYKVGIASRVRAYHLFGDNWGYPEEVTPEIQGHNPDLKDYVKQFDQPTAYDSKTFLPL